MADLITLFTVFLTIFLFGMTVLRVGLYQLSYRNMKVLLQRFANNPFKGMLAGIVVTSVLQSSSATMVIAIGLVAVGVLNFKQSIGIILGANIGTTVTAELLTFSNSIPLWPLLIIGAVLLIIPKQTWFGAGGILFGLGCIFVALNGFESLAEPLKQFPIIQDSLAYTNDFPNASILIGTAMTAIIQSSTAATGISMSFLNEGIFSLTSAIGIMLGANIGTCITAWVASLGSNYEARLVAMAHIWLNVLGVLLFAPFIDELAALSQWLSNDPAQQLAHISVVFNVLSSLIVLPFVQHFTKFVMFVHKYKE
ncbi:Na/Pi symporter [Pontibacillus salipaludis]|uniref:Phosphate:Na+ symporter n=1 Tax=Pontibacillus salipaludis TaxID=1697394 RepID=A0ABQ1PUL4_9BACI|nr:Na/Pi symporter [Pontibacillus salipaludis]GGD04422.1 hypothetical protein GCM10011389_09970 [Pontibacillus salipaludis]